MICFHWHGVGWGSSDTAVMNMWFRASRKLKCLNAHIHPNVRFFKWLHHKVYSAKKIMLCGEKPHHRMSL